jgi:hypothetical protein
LAITVEHRTNENTTRKRYKINLFLNYWTTLLPNRCPKLLFHIAQLLLVTMQRRQPLRNAAAGQQQGPQFGPEIDPQMGAPADQIDEPGAGQEVHGAHEDVAGANEDFANQDVNAAPLEGEITWRFCNDYRKLNDCTRSASWPIPNIQQMFGR